MLKGKTKKNLDIHHWLLREIFAFEHFLSVTCDPMLPCSSRNSQSASFLPRGFLWCNSSQVSLEPPLRFVLQELLVRIMRKNLPFIMDFHNFSHNYTRFHQHTNTPTLAERFSFFQERREYEEGTGPKRQGYGSII
jgi:hypothetical protein